MSIHDDQPFHYKGGDFIPSLRVNYRGANADGSENLRPYLIGLANIEQLSLQTEHAERLMLDLFTALYDHDGISMDTAGRLHTMCLTVLQDPREATEAAMMEAGEDF